MSEKFSMSTILKEKTEIIDLSNLNLFETTKEIIISSTNLFNKNSDKKIVYKVSTPNIKNILKDIPISNNVELIF